MSDSGGRPSRLSPSTPAADESPAEDLARAGARGALWQGGAFVVGKGVVLLTTVILARLLAPEQFGLVSLALVLIVFAEAVADVGVAQAVVYLPASRATTRAAVLCSTVFGILLAAGGILAAPLVGTFFHRNDVVPLVRLLALSLIASALGAVPEALLRRALLFRRLTLATVTRAVVTGVVSMALAFLGYGAWALAWGTVAGAVSYAIATWALRPRLDTTDVTRVTWRALSAVLAYGLPVAGANLLARLIFDVDYLIVGHQLGAEALGYYTLAFRIPELLIVNVFFVISSVTFPLYSKARADPDRLRRGYLFSVRLQSLYGLCVGVGIAIVASLLVPLLFGVQWLPIVAPLVALALYAAVRSLGAGANDVYKAMGRPGLSLVLSIVRLVVLVPALLAATRWGIVGVAWAQVITSLLFVVLMQTTACRLLGVRVRDLATAMSPALLAGVAIVAVALPLTFLPVGTPLRLVLGVLGGVFAAGLLLLLRYRAFVDEVLGMLGVRREPVQP